MDTCMFIDCKKLENNVKEINMLCAQNGIQIVGITKVFGGDRTLVSILFENGIHMLGDSRIENLKKYADISCEKWLIRMPAISEAEETVLYADVSLNSEIETLKELDKCACICHKHHKVILMVDLGDLREGYIEEDELHKSVEYVKNAKCLELYGLGTNLTCFSFVRPDAQKLELLYQLAKKYDATTMLSGGNSATIHLMLQHQIPRGINSLRLGESVLFGRERDCYEYLPHMYSDIFTLSAEVIECKEKPSMPWGRIGPDSYGNIPKFEDVGIRKRVICAVGRQDIDTETMWPLDDGIKIIGASSDHMILDTTDSDREYRVGSHIQFRLGYFSTMRAFTSRYIKKKYLGGKQPCLI